MKVAAFVAAALALASTAMAEQTFLRVNLTQAATENGAVCLDGSTPLYYLWKGDPTKWVVFFMGGGWCYNEELCALRANSSLGSSTFYGPTYVPTAEGGNGILSNDSTLNPTFYNYSMVFMVYCDGASYSGNVEQPVVVNGQTIYFRGHRILQGLFTDIFENQGAKGATDLVLSGCSAGGLAVYHHCDEWASFAAKYAAPGAKVRCVADAGYFVDLPNVNDVEVIRPEYQYVFQMQNTSGGVDASCIASTAPENQWICFFAQYALPHISTPVFVVNSGYDWWQAANIWFMSAPFVGTTLPDWLACAVYLPNCTTVQLMTVAQYHALTLQALAPALNPASANGAFISSCLAHCQLDQEWTLGPTLNGVDIATVVGAWYTGAAKGADVQLVMPPYPDYNATTHC